MFFSSFKKHTNSVSLGSYPIYAFGTEEQKKKYLIPLAKGEQQHQHLL